MRPTILKTHRSDEDGPDDDCMNIELQPTDLSGSSHDVDDEMDFHHHRRPQDQQSPQQQNALSKDQDGEVGIIRLPRIQLSRRQYVGLLVGIFPVVLFAFEMVDEWCHLCLDDVEIDAYFFTAAFCGGVGAVLVGEDSKYWHARMIGGGIAACGSLGLIFLLLSSNVSSKLGILFFLIVGAMPGFVAYYIIKITTHECFLTGPSDDFDAEYSTLSLTEPLTEEQKFQGEHQS
jgi:hypothetical protein